MGYDKRITIVGIAFLLIIIGISLVFVQKEKESNVKSDECFTFPLEIKDNKIIGTWINTSVNESDSYFSSLYKFFSNGTCYTPDRNYKYKIVIDLGENSRTVLYFINLEYEEGGDYYLWYWYKDQNTIIIHDFIDKEFEYSKQ